jgi:hypothetical protein
MHRFATLRSGRGTRIRKRYLAIPALVTALAGSAGSAAHGASLSIVVPPGGTVAGHGYAYWLAAGDRIFFDSGGSPGPCQTLYANGDAVSFLDGANTSGDINCSVPAGQPLYVHGVQNECSTFEGDHNGFGTSPPQLQLCARRGFEHLSGAAFIDGTSVSSYRELIAAAEAVEVNIPANNSFGITGGPGTSAAYGEGLLLRGLAAGTHTIRIVSITPGGDQTRTFIVHVG